MKMGPEQFFQMLLAINEDLRAVAENPNAHGHPEFLARIDSRSVAIRAELDSLDEPRIEEVEQPQPKPQVLAPGEGLSGAQQSPPSPSRASGTGQSRGGGAVGGGNKTAEVEP